MKYKQMQMILEPTSIEQLFEENVDNDTLAEAMLLNWEQTGSLIIEDEDYWKCLFELPDEFIWEDEVLDYDSYKNHEWRILVIRIKDRFFAYYYDSNPYDTEYYGEHEEVYPVPKISYSVSYRSDKTQTKEIEITKQYKELFKMEEEND